MSKVWVQLWTAKVPNSVQVDKLEIEKIAGLENLKPMLPMLVNVDEKGWQVLPTPLVKDSPLIRAEELNEVLEPWRD
jgi:hypothetical protein